VTTKTLVVTNDFPPRPGGIQSFVYALAVRRPPGSVVVYAPAWDGDTAFDARQPFPVIRHPGSLMLPVPAVLRRARELVLAHGCDTVVFGAAAPLGLLARGLRRGSGIGRIVAITHGHEAGWAMLPGARSVLRRIGDDVDVVTYLGDYFRSRLGSALSPAAAARMVRLTPGVDLAAFQPGSGGAQTRARLGLAGQPVVVCVSRLVPRKGQDTLIRAWPQVRAAVPAATLLLVGDGSYRSSLERLAKRLRVASSVMFTGSVPWQDLPGYFDAGNVFAMPCRTRRGGLDVEGLGIVYLEASACGLPVVAGSSGGAPDAVLAGQTGYVVDGRSARAVAGRLIELLSDGPTATAMGEKGRAWVEAEWNWDLVAQRFDHILAGRPERPARWAE
jgi:phosphatidylinositol alpha-1,6-mannosyltransferase